MNSAKGSMVFCLLAEALLVACGSPGVPLPPSLELARPVADLRAVRKGENVFLTWSVPTQTTEKRNIRRFGPTQICRSTSAEMRECGTAVAELSPQLSSQPTTASAQPAREPQASFTDQLPLNTQSPSTSANIFYAVNVLNSYGKSAGLSNGVQVPSVPTLPPPADFHAQLTGDGVRLIWNPIAAFPKVSGLRYIYRIYRRDLDSSNDVIAGELPATGEAAPSLLDHSLEWERTYDYRATVVTITTPTNLTEQQVEGDDTASVRVFAHDVFPPAVPSGLQAVFSGPGQKPFIDLVWAPDTDADLAGYNVYRREEGTQPTKINSEPSKSAAFRDSQVSSGHKYFYSVSAVDMRGNESAQSEEASETVP
jgi:hypothetical protein